MVAWMMELALFVKNLRLGLIKDRKMVVMKHGSVVLVMMRKHLFLYCFFKFNYTLYDFFYQTTSYI